MLNRLKFLCIPNLFELNALLIFAGFPVFTQLVYGQEENGMNFGEQGSSYSIIYRIFCLIISILVIYKSYAKRKLLYFPKELKWTFAIFILMSIKLLYSLFLSPYSNVWPSYFIITRLSFLFGVTFFPLYALVLSFKYINWHKLFLLILILLTYVCLSTLMFSANEISKRIDLNSHQSTLAFGAYSAYIVIISIIYLSINKHSLMKICLFVVFVIGIFGLLKAGSRGPFISTIASIVPLFVIKKKFRKYIVLIIIGIIFFGSILYGWLQTIAPVIFERLNDATNKDTSTMERLIAFNLALEQMNNYPLTGESPIFYTKWAFGFGPHNLWLQIGMGLGYFGFVWACILYIKYFLQAIKSLNSDYIDAIFGSLMLYFLMRTQTGVDIYGASDFGMIIIGLYLRKALNNKRYLDKKQCTFYNQA